MARTAINAITPKGPYPGTINAGDLLIAGTAADVANSNLFAGPGKFLVVVQNTDVGAQTFTISSVKDQLGRSGDVNAYSMAASTFAAFLLETLGWLQPDGNFYLSASSANVKFFVFKLPY